MFVPILRCNRVKQVKLMTSIGTFVLGAVLGLATMSSLPAAPAQSAFTVSDSAFLLNGKPFQIKAGEMHPGRIPHQYWADRLRMMHAMGLNTVSIYVFWNQHEPRQGEFD